MSIPLAGQLWKARSEGTLINLATVEVPVDEDAAYKIQDGISQIAAAKIIGFKVGATTDAAVAALGVSEPFHGPLWDRYCHRSGDEVALSSAHQVLIETEITEGLDTDLPPRERDYTQRDVNAATRWGCPAFESAAARVETKLAGKG